MTSVLSSIKIPHWLMIAGSLLLVLGIVELIISRTNVRAEPTSAAAEQRSLRSKVTWHSPNFSISRSQADAARSAGRRACRQPKATSAASMRVATSSLARIRSMCLSTVRFEMQRARAIS